MAVDVDALLNEASNASRNAEVRRLRALAEAPERSVREEAPKVAATIPDSVVIATLNEIAERVENEMAALRAENKRLRSVCGEAYQLAGAIEAPVNALDNLSDAASGHPLRHDTFLPILDTDCGVVQRLTARVEEQLRVATHTLLLLKETQAELKQWQDYWGCEDPHDSVQFCESQLIATGKGQL